MSWKRLGNIRGFYNLTTGKLSHFYQYLKQCWLKILWKMWTTKKPYDEQLHIHNQTEHGSWLPALTVLTMSCEKTVRKTQKMFLLTQRTSRDAAGPSSPALGTFAAGRRAYSKQMCADSFTVRNLTQHHKNFFQLNCLQKQIVKSYSLNDTELLRTNMLNRK